ncbi:uncharacterized protein LOC130700392 [Daphnia carinata]|uniref:uncharacterized protein LOC130700392 n=1 Tax=Daphnia carinata TaxID=120202 RepID=UPI00257BF964|nr:uncharacterized protein LOC130700392 [Daphnia carinata]
METASFETLITSLFTMRKNRGIIAWLVLCGVSISCAAPWFNANVHLRAKSSAREDLPDYAQTEQPFFNFMKMGLTEAPLETDDESPSVVQAHPMDFSPLYPVEEAQKGPAIVEDPLYDFLKNILPQVPARAPDSPAPNVAASDSVDPSADAPVRPQTYASSDESFLNIGHPPKPRALGFPQITNTRENVFQQNNWDIL